MSEKLKISTELLAGSIDVRHIFILAFNNPQIALRVKVQPLLDSEFYFYTVI
jgi:hypothetical protein